MKKLFLIVLYIVSLASCGRKDWYCSATIVTHHDGKTDTIQWQNVYSSKHCFKWYTRTDKDKTTFWVVPDSNIGHLRADEHKPITFPGLLEVIDFQCYEKKD